MPSELTDEQFARLLDFRVSLRRFARWSQDAAEGAGLSPAQHQLLVAIRGHRGGRGPTIADVSRYLLIRHHSALGLVQRAQAAGLVERHGDPDDQRLVRLGLTPLGDQRVHALSALHLEELRRLAPLLQAVVESATAGRGRTPHRQME